jgi:hypothetical protein
MKKVFLPIAILLDLIFINLSFLVAIKIRSRLFLPNRPFTPTSLQNLLEVVFLLSLMYFFSLLFLKGYRKKFSSVEEIFRVILLSFFVASLFSFTLLYIFRSRWGYMPSSVFILAFVINVASVFLEKVSFYKLSKRIYKNILFVDNENINNILSHLKEIDELIITHSIKDINQVYLLIALSKEKGIKLSISPKIYEEIIRKKIAGGFPTPSIPPVFLHERKIGMWEETIIRVVDVALASLILFILSPLLLLIAILIKLDSPGSVIYKQVRVGKDGKEFILYKFRSMQKDAEKNLGFLPATKDRPSSNTYRKDFETDALR